MQPLLSIAAEGDVTLHCQPRTFYRSVWEEADRRPANPECALTDGGAPAAKLIGDKGPVAGATWLRNMGCHGVSLANNHAMD